MSFNVYMIDLLGNSRGIFVQTSERGSDSGHLYQVIGDIKNGMIDAHREIKRPKNSSKFIGTVSKSQYSQVRVVCDSITAEPLEIDSVNSLRHHREWVNQVIDVFLLGETKNGPIPYRCIYNLNMSRE
ncbi:hypothetical protein MFRU_009g03670 [Monilinia fructicola]|nr:hypothetical protein MFRU_009g03670 [Monilinia fructicola]